MKKRTAFPAAMAAGLLTGWLLSPLVSRAPREERARTAPSPVNSIPGRPSGESSGAWEKMLEARTLPPVPAIILDNADRFAVSPARRDLNLELARHGMPENLISGTLLGFPATGGDPGFAETYGRLARTQPERAMAEVNRLAGGSLYGRWDPQTIDRARRLILREWVRRNPLEAVKSVSEAGYLPYFQRSRQLEMLMAEWVGGDPAAAAAAIATLPESVTQQDRKSLAGTVLREWQTKDPAAARRWAETEANAAWRESLLAVADEFAANDPAGKAGVLLAMQDRRPGDLARVFSEWFSADPDAAVQKLSSIPPDDPFWSTEAADIAQHWAVMAQVQGGASPDGFLEKVRNVTEGLPRDSLLKGLADYGASNDPSFAVRILAEMKEGRAKEAAAGNLAELWLRRDPVQTSQWLDSLPTESAARHSAVARFAEGLAADDPVRAAQWAETLPGDYWQREGVLKTVMEKWQAKDPRAAEAWEHRQQGIPQAKEKTPR
ncbi:MAG: hypothetical protein JWM59_2946 [Verrucomicrobiales bacterium]|nr:hypothetical protein [Verrucomicrobiales bacterium]